MRHNVIVMALAVAVLSLAVASCTKDDNCGERLAAVAGDDATVIAVVNPTAIFESAGAITADGQVALPDGLVGVSRRDAQCFETLARVEGIDREEAIAVKYTGPSMAAVALFVTDGGKFKKSMAAAGFEYTEINDVDIYVGEEYNFAVGVRDGVAWIVRDGDNAEVSKCVRALNGRVDAKPLAEWKHERLMADGDIRALVSGSGNGTGDDKGNVVSYYAFDATFDGPELKAGMCMLDAAGATADIGLFDKIDESQVERLRGNCLAVLAFGVAESVDAATVDAAAGAFGLDGVSADFVRNLVASLGGTSAVGCCEIEMLPSGSAVLNFKPGRAREVFDGIALLADSQGILKHRSDDKMQLDLMVYKAEATIDGDAILIDLGSPSGNFAMPAGVAGNDLSFSVNLTREQLVDLIGRVEFGLDLQVRYGDGKGTLSCKLTGAKGGFLENISRL